MKISEPNTIDTITSFVGSTRSLIVHTIVFIGAFSVAGLGLVSWDRVLLVVTTIVSLEAIYLSILIQISVNRAKENIVGVGEDIAEIEENLGEISEDIEGIEKDVAGLEEELGEVSEDIEEMQEDITELAVEDNKDADRKRTQSETLISISTTLTNLISEIEKLKHENHHK